MDELTLPYDILRFDYKERLPDRFLATHLHRFEMFTKPVALAVLVEIISPWHPASTLGQKIINSLVREFQRGESQSYLARFESSLKQTNRVVQEALDQIKSPISCVAVLLEFDQIHSSSIGTAKLGLQRNGRLATVLGAKSNYNATFAAVTSGDLNPGDWLALANEAFYSTLAQLDNQTWLTDDIGEIGTKLNEPTQFENERRSAGILLRLNSLSPPANQTFLWGEERPPQRNVSFLKWPIISFGVWRSLFISFNDWIGRLWRVIIKKLSRGQGDRPEAVRSSSLRKLPKVAGRPLLIAALLLLCLIVVWLGYRQAHRGQTIETSKTNLLTDLRGIPSEKLLGGLDQNFTVSAYQGLSDTDRAELNTLLQTQRIYLTDLPAATAQTPSEIVSLDALNDQIIMIDNRGQVWSSDGSLLSKMAQKILISNPISLTAFGPTNIIVADTLGNIWRLDGSKNQPLALAQDSTSAKGAKLLSRYRGNLYFIDLLSKVTTRVSNFTDNLTGSSIYSKAENLANISNPSDIAVNAKVLIADSSGLVVEFARNAVGKTKFQLPFVNGSVRLATSDSTDLTVVGSGRTLFLIDSADTLDKTIFLTDNPKITDIVLDPANPTKLWLASGKELHSLNLP